jgi:hypothetical protein
MAAAGFDGYVANGCGVGLNEYALGNGYRVDDAVQAFSVVHPDLGVIGHHPVWFTDAAAEGWG